MSLLKSVLEEIIGLFIDDGKLALSCAALIAVVAVSILLGLPGLWGGILLIAGCIAILAWSVARAFR